MRRMRLNDIRCVPLTQGKSAIGVVVVPKVEGGAPATPELQSDSDWARRARPSIWTRRIREEESRKFPRADFWWGDAPRSFNFAPGSTESRPTGV